MLHYTMVYCLSICFCIMFFAYLLRSIEIYKQSKIYIILFVCLSTVLYSYFMILHPHTFEGIGQRQLLGLPSYDVTANQVVWLAARTLEDFSRASADWLEGSIGQMPRAARYDCPNEETQGLLPSINRINRSSIFASTHSQTARSFGNDPYGAILEEQRATLSGLLIKILPSVCRKLRIISGYCFE